MPYRLVCKTIPKLYSALFLELFCLLFFLHQCAVFHNVVIFTTLETPRELFSGTVSWFAEILLLGILFGLLERLLELPGEYGYIFLIKVLIIFLQGHQSKASISFGLLLQLRARPKLRSLKIAN